jgi:nitrile hydratase
MSGDHDGPQASIAARVRHLEDLLEQRGLVDAAQLDRDLAEFLARASPANGGRVAARAWIDQGFRQRLLADANAALPELGLNVWDASAESRYMVLPRRPVGTAGLGEAELAAMVTRNGLIGVASI